MTISPKIIDLDHNFLQKEMAERDFCQTRIFSLISLAMCCVARVVWPFI